MSSLSDHPMARVKSGSMARMKATSMARMKATSMERLADRSGHHLAWPGLSSREASSSIERGATIIDDDQTNAP